MTSASSPNTIVLIHGFWVTPRSWERWKARYEGAGYTVLTPAYPGFEVEVEALRENPQPIEDVTFPAIVEHLEGIIGALDRPPILMGHSAGGAITQVLMDHGCGAVGVVMNSAPTEGVPVAPFSQIKSTWPILGSLEAHHKAVGFTFEQWQYAFTNGLPEDQARYFYDRYHIPASGQILWNSVKANLIPGHQDTWVEYHNDDRAPLLFMSGDRDHIMPPKVQASNAKHYKSDKTLTETRTYEGPHLMIAADGWEQIADDALAWAVAHARPAEVSA